ncbi:MAG: LPS-assembly protein LptD [Deltaproteobacteria bacterium]|nr:LPS-assembly protein LptD [Deltaproteobacteria bacterium]
MRGPAIRGGGRALAWGLTLVILGLLWTATATAQPPPLELEISPDKPWILRAERLDAQEGGQVVEAHGQVVLESEGERLTAEHARFDRRSNTLEAWGGVIWYHGSDILQAERIVLNLANEIGRAYDARLFLSGNHFHLTGRQIEKTGRETYVVRDCTLTSCDGRRPDWVIKAAWMRVTVDGYGHLVLPRFKVGPVPILFLPYAVFPAKTKRQTGFLMPQLTTSLRDGVTWDLPFYWAWADWGETTFYWHHSERGEGVGAQLRFMLGHHRDQGLFFFDYLDDRQAKERYAAGELSRDESERYWFRGMLRADQLLPWKVSMRLVVDYPSDPEIIPDFAYWETGIARINRDLRQRIGQTLRDSTEIERLNTLQFRRRWTGSNAYLEFRYYRDPTPAPEGAGPDETIQYLPRASYSLSDKAIGRSNFYYNYRLQAFSAFRERDGEDGQEMDARFNLYALFNLGPYLNLQPRLGGRATYWNVARGEDSAQDFTAWRDRYYPQAGLEISTSVFKVYDIGGLKTKKIKHQISPQINLFYVPPHYDPAPTSYSSQVDPAEIIGWRLVNTLIAKKRQGQAHLMALHREFHRRGRLEALTRWFAGQDRYTEMGEEELETEYQRQLRLAGLKRAPSYGYLRFLSLELSQSFDLREVRLDKDDDAPRRPFSDFRADLVFRPSGYLYNRTTVYYDPYSGRLSKLYAALNLLSRRGDSLRLAYRWRWNPDEDPEIVSQLDSGLNLKLFGPFSTSGGVVYDFDDHQSISRWFNLYLTRQCWSVALNYTRTTDDERVALVFSLFGLGQIYRYETSLEEDGALY